MIHLFVHIGQTCRCRCVQRVCSVCWSARGVSRSTRLLLASQGGFRGRAGGGRRGDQFS